MKKIIILLVFGLTLSGTLNANAANLAADNIALEVQRCDDYATQTTNYIIMNHHLMYDNEAYVTIWMELYNDCMG